jgi:hypothetical protein
LYTPAGRLAGAEPPAPRGHAMPPAPPEPRAPPESTPSEHTQATQQASHAAAAAAAAATAHAAAAATGAAAGGSGAGAAVAVNTGAGAAAAPTDRYVMDCVSKFKTDGYVGELTDTASINDGRSDVRYCCDFMRQLNRWLECVRFESTQQRGVVEKLRNNLHAAIAAAATKGFTPVPPLDEARDADAAISRRPTAGARFGWRLSVMETFVGRVFCVVLRARPPGVCARDVRACARAVPRAGAPSRHSAR